MPLPGSFSLYGRRTRGPAVVGAVICAATISAQAAMAQATVTNPPNTQEFGVDAGAVFGLGSQSSVDITLPAARARIGFFLNDASRWSIEPAGFFGYSKVKDLPSALVYNLEAGLLYHFRAPADVYRGSPALVAYVRPFVGVSGTRSGGTSNNEFEAGGGLGVKVPWRRDVAFRFEGNLGYGFSNKAARIGAFAGLSFFTRNGIPVPGM